MDDTLDSLTRRYFRMHFNLISSVLAGIGNKTRFEILLLLLDHKCKFQEIQTMLDLKKTACAHHLRNLTENGLIRTRKRGEYWITTNGKILLNSISRGFIGGDFDLDNELIHEFGEEKAGNNQEVRLSNEQSGKNEMKKKMNSTDFDVISIPPMRVASFRAISRSPEEDAWKLVKKFVKEKRIEDDLEHHQIYGFNNPDPAPDKKEYGYEFWIKMDSSFNEENTLVKDFPGGLYAVKRCNLTKESQSAFLQKFGMLESWSLLHDWVLKSPYEPAKHQWLEKAINPGKKDSDLLLDLCFPIQRKY